MRILALLLLLFASGFSQESPRTGTTESPLQSLASGKITKVSVYRVSRDLYFRGALKPEQVEDHAGYVLTMLDKPQNGVILLREAVKRCKLSKSREVAYDLRTKVIITMEGREPFIVYMDSFKGIQIGSTLYESNGAMQQWIKQVGNDFGR